jgi:hypothetical protein
MLIKDFSSSLFKYFILDAKQTKLLTKIQTRQCIIKKTF